MIDGELRPTDRVTRETLQATENLTSIMRIASALSSVEHFDP